MSQQTAVNRLRSVYTELVYLILEADHTTLRPKFHELWKQL